MFAGDAHSFAAALEEGSGGAAPRSVTSGPYVPTSRYGDGRRFNPLAILAIVAAHVALLAALVLLDVVPLKREEPPMMAVFIAEAVPPPPAAPAELPPPPEPVRTQMVTPPPVVAPPVARPVQMAAVETPPPPQPVAVAAAAPSPLPAPPVAAPVVPPSMSGNQKDTPLPRYPAESNRRRETGTVTLLVLVSPAGLPDQVKVKTSSGHDRLDKAALEAVRRWKFSPATQAGQPVSAWMIVPIPFQLKTRGA